MQYLTFRLKAVEYAVDVRIVDTVVEHEATTAVPSPVDYMKGVMNLRGQVIPVIDLGKKFGLPEGEQADHASVIVIRVDAGQGKTLTVGALVDEVSAVVDIEESNIEAARTEGVALWERFVRGVIRFEERMVVIVEAEALFSIKEIESLRVA